MEQGIHWAITSTGAKVYREDAEAAGRLQKALDALNAKNAKLETDLGALRQQLVRTGKAKEDAAQKADRYTRSQRLVAQIVEKTGVSHTTARRAVALFGRDIDRAEKEAQQYATAMDRAEREVRELAAAQRQANQGMSFGARIAMDLARNLLFTAGALLGVHQAARQARESLKAALDYEDSLTRLNTLAGVQKELVAEWSTELLKLGPATRTVATDLVPALFAIASGGTRGREALVDLQDAARASAIGLGEAEDIARLATAAYQAYGRAAFVAVKPTDIVGAAALEGSFKVDQLADKLGEAIPLAVAMGIEFGELGGAVAAFTKLGVGVDVSLNGIRALLAALQKPSTEAEDAFRRIGTSAAEVRARLADEGLAPVLVELLGKLDAIGEGADSIIPNIRAMTAALATAGVQGEEYVRIADRVATAQGFIDDRFRETAEGTPEQLAALEASYSSLRILIGQQIVGALRSGLLPALHDAAEGTAEWLAANNELLAGLGRAAALLVSGVLTAIGDVGKAVGFLAEQWRLLATALLLFSLKSVPAAAAALQSLHASIMGLGTILGISAGWFLYLGLALYGVGKAAGLLADSYARDIGRMVESTETWRREQDELTAAIESGSRALIENQIASYTAQQTAAAEALAKSTRAVAQATADLAAARARAQQAQPNVNQRGDLVPSQAMRDAAAEVQRYRAALESAHRARGEATAEDRAATDALARLREALANVGLKEHTDRVAALEGAQRKLLDSLVETTRQINAQARAYSAQADAIKDGPRAVDELTTALEIQAKVEDQVAKARAEGLDQTAAFRAELARYRAELENLAEEERRLAGEETLDRLRRAIAIEAAQAAGLKGVVAELEAQAEIAEAVTRATDEQADEIERLIRLQRSLRAAREQASVIRKELDAVEALREENAARAQGQAALDAYLERRELEAYLLERMVTGLPQEIALLAALFQARKREQDEARRGETLHAWRDELEILRRRNAEFSRGIALGLSAEEAARRAHREAEIARIRQETRGIGLDEASIRAYVEEVDALQLAFEQSTDHLDAARDSLASVAQIFSMIGGEFADLLSRAVDIADKILAAVQATQVAQGFGGGGVGGAVGGLGQAAGGVPVSGGGSASAAGAAQSGATAAGTAAAFSAAAAWIAVAVALVEVFNAIAEERRSKRFSYEASIAYSSAGYTGAPTFDPRVNQSGPDMLKLWNQLRDQIDQFRVAMGLVLTAMQGLNIQVRQDGEKFRATLNGVVLGVFPSMEEAIRHGLMVALTNANWEGIGENVARALRLIQDVASHVDLQALAEMLPRLQELDLVAAGVNEGLARSIVGWRQWLTMLDIESEHLLEVGVPLEQVLDMRRREIAAAYEQARAQGLSLIGIGDVTGGLGAWIDQLRGLETALEDEGKRTEQLAEVATDTSGSLGGHGGGGRDGGLVGAIGDTGEAADMATGSVVAFSHAAGDLGDAAVEGGPAAASATEAFIALVREVKRLEAASSLLRDLLDFQERTGVQLVDNATLRDRIAEMEFRLFQIRFQQTVLELVAAAELLGLTRRQIAEYQRWAAAVADLDFSDIQIGAGRGGRAGSRRQARESAADSVADLMQDVADWRAGTTSATRSYLDEQAEVAEAYRLGAITAEQLAAATTALAEMQVEELLNPWREAVRAAGESDAERAYREIGERAAESIAQAVAAGLDSPAFRAEVAAGSAAELAALGQDLLAGLSPDVAQAAGIAETVAQIGFLMDHLAELGLTAAQVGDAVEQGVGRSLLDMAIAEARRTGNRAAEERYLEQRAVLERAYMLAQLEGLRLMLEAAGRWSDAWQATYDEITGMIGAPDAAPGTDLDGEGKARSGAQLRDELDRMVDALSGPVLGSLRAARRAYAETAAEIEDLAVTSEEAAAAMAIADADLAAATREAAGSLMSEIERLYRAAGVELPVEQAQAWARAQLEIARAQALMALADEELVAVLQQAGVDVAALTAGLVDLDFAVGGLGDEVQRVPRGRSRAQLRDDRGGGEAQGETLAEILDEMRRRAQSPMEALRQTWLDMVDRIAKATGTAAEREQALAAAREEYARAVDKLVRDAFRSAQDLIDELQGAGGALGGPPGRHLEEGLANLRELGARAAAGDLEAAEQLGASGADLLALIERISGGRERIELSAEVRDILAAALAAAGIDQPPLNVPPPEQLRLPTATEIAAASAVSLTGVIDTMRAEAASDRRHMEALTQAHIRSDERLHGELLPAVIALRAQVPPAGPNDRGRRV